MSKLSACILTIVSFVLVTPAASAVNGFTIVNQTGGALSAVALRRVGDTTWQPVVAAPASGASARANFKDNDCAFDLRGTVVGVGQVMWKGVNLCDVKSVTLNRDSSGRQWVDYD